MPGEHYGSAAVPKTDEAGPIPVLGTLEDKLFIII